jgi:hypothetical protein
MYVQSPEPARGVTDSVQVEELWDSMCQSTIALVNKSLPTIDNDDKLLKIKGVIALFVQTMGVSFVPFPRPEASEDADKQRQSWGYSVDSLDQLLLTIFDKYAQLLKQRFSEDFQEVSVDRGFPFARFVLRRLTSTRRLFRRTTICPCLSTTPTSTTRSSTSVGIRQTKTASSKSMSTRLEYVKT